MSTDERPVVVAYDGSPESQAAVRAAAELFRARTLVVVSVWEPGLALAMTAPPDGLSGMSYTPPAPETMAMMDDVERNRASDTATAGAELARSLGATVEPHPVPDDRDVAETLVGVADKRDAAAHGGRVAGPRPRQVTAVGLDVAWAASAHAPSRRRRPRTGVASQTRPEGAP